MKKVLVANRGEIAVRIIRTLKEMSIQSVAIYSDADRKSPHVQLADEAFHIGPSPSNQSYLLGDKIIALCVANNVDGIHPGYGFLSENAEFAQKVIDAGINFIGPSPESIRLMGNKLSAKKTVEKFKIPMVPGTDKSISDIDKAKEIADDIGYPILIKAAAGGGGKGMRIVREIENFESQMKLAISEAESSFGDGSIFIEKYITSPRHIEIQILGDKHGNIIHLFERECSIQRRHQKVIEEAPSVALTDDLRNKMGQTAIQVAKSCNYYSTGTVEFLLDNDSNYYFLEMNTRLQVEHPVTEYITGLDLVEQQIKVANGEVLDVQQDELQINGHSIELRVYAEDPLNGFLPDIGNLKTYRVPKGHGVRVDDGFNEGMDIPIYYDPMIAKLIVHGKNRDQAITRMSRAIDEYHINGFATTLAFGKEVMSSIPFKEGLYDTHFIDQHYNPKTEKQNLQNAALVAGWLKSNSNQNTLSNDKISNHSSWLNRRKTEFRD